MSLEIRGFSERGETPDVFALADAAGVFAAGGEFVHQALKAVDGPAVRGLFSLLLSLNGLAGLGLGDGIAVPANRVEFFVLEQHRSDGLARVPFDIVCEHT